MTIKIMKKQIGNMSKFSFAEMTSNSDGKTSASGTMGVLITIVGTICFFLGCIDKMWLNKDIDIITQSIIFTGIGVSLLGLRKYKANDFVAFIDKDLTQKKEDNSKNNETGGIPTDLPLNS